MSSSIDAKKIMAVVKSNIVIAVCVIVIIGSLVGLPYVSDGLMEEVKASVEKQSRSYNNLKKIRDGKITIPGATPVKAVVSQAIIDRIQDVANGRKNESVSVLDAAKSINRANHVNLDNRLFPGHDLPSHELQVEAPRFQKRVVEEYKSLLEDVNAGMPPSEEAVMKGLDQVRQQFLDNHLRRDTVKGLSESEINMVRAELSERCRMGLYLREAEKSGVYLQLSQLDPPVYNERQTYTSKELFRWQWRFWVVEEILHAIRQVNGPEATVIKAPIKRVLSLRVRDLMSIDDTGGADQVVDRLREAVSPVGRRGLPPDRLEWQRAPVQVAEGPPSVPLLVAVVATVPAIPEEAAAIQGLPPANLSSLLQCRRLVRRTSARP